MDPIRTLMDEHQLILKSLDALDEYVEQAAPAPKDLALFVKFIREFADAFHHGKEEDILFAEMQANGFPANAGPLAVMLAEHDEGRRLTGRMAAVAEQAGAWSAADLEQVRDAAHGYTELLRGHIHKEDNILYPMAQGHLPESSWQQIAKRFDEFAQAKATSGDEQRLRALAADLVERYGGSAR